jgi:hypothetical protein
MGNRMSDNPFKDLPDSNPYASPAGEASPTNPLFIPAVVLLVLSILYLLLQIAAMPRQIVQIMNADTSTPAGQAEQVGQSTFVVLIFPLEIVVLLGSVGMIRLRGYRSAFIAAIIALIPVCSPCFVLGIPFGIWAIVLLLKPEVKGRFTK